MSGTKRPGGDISLTGLTKRLRLGGTIVASAGGAANPLDDASSTASTDFSPSSAPTPSTPLTPSQPLDDRTCPHCFRRFPRRPADLKKHLKVHSTERPFACDHQDCGKTFKTEKDLKEHIDYNHLNIRHFQCSHVGCGKSFNSAHRLRRHDYQVHKSGIRCTHPGCDQRFRNHNTLERHMREHDGRLPYACKVPGCGAEFPDHNGWARHKEKEHSDRQYWCTDCQLSFRNGAELKNHHRKTHFNCSFCSDKFRSRDDLDQHIEDFHTQPLEERKNVPCPWQGCPKHFTRVSNLNAHYRTAHEGVRYVCGQTDVSSAEEIKHWSQENGCAKTFTTKLKLIEHIMYIHLHLERPEALVKNPYPNILDELAGISNQMPEVYSCNLAGCDRMFKRITDLERHKAAHKTLEEKKTKRQARKAIKAEASREEARAQELAAVRSAAASSRCPPGPGYPHQHTELFAPASMPYSQPSDPGSVDPAFSQPVTGSSDYRIFNADQVMVGSAAEIGQLGSDFGIAQPVSAASYPDHVEMDFGEPAPATSDLGYHNPVPPGYAEEDFPQYSSYPDPPNPEEVY